MLTVAILINGHPVLARSARNTGRKSGNRSIYAVDDGSEVEHDPLLGAAELAKILLDTIKPPFNAQQPEIPEMEPDFSFNDLPVRARKVAKTLGASDLHEIAMYTEEELMECRNCGRSTISVLRRFLQANGLKFRDEKDGRYKSLPWEIQKG